MLAVFAVFLAPVAAAWLWFHYGSGFTQANHGRLYDPARPFLDDLALAVAAGSPSRAALAGRWVLLYLSHGPCAEPCLRQLDKVNRARLTQGEKMQRVAMLYVGTGRAAVAGELARAFPGGVVAALDGPGAERALATLRRADETEPMLKDRMYIIDPLGNLVLSYPADAPASRVAKDLSRLLRVSRIG